MQQAPIQLYELYNGGQLPVEFEFDLQPLEVFKRDHFQHAVFECLEPSGIVQPGVKHLVQWRFSPLEEKLYAV